MCDIRCDLLILMSKRMQMFVWFYGVFSKETNTLAQKKIYIATSLRYTNNLCLWMFRKLKRSPEARKLETVPEVHGSGMPGHSRTLGIHSGIPSVFHVETRPVCTVTALCILLIQPPYLWPGGCPACLPSSKICDGHRLRANRTTSGLALVHSACNQCIYL